ncbi:MAG: MMPL family transporter, partial [Phycisphaeraceae bacterium]|nr:MMPL family transporter [Phycisphaeraceae bacterium]
MDTYTRLVLKARWPLLIFCVGAVVASLAVLPRLQLDFSIVPLMEASEAERRQVRQIDRALPMALMPVTCVLEWPDRLGMQQLEQLRRFENALAETPGVRRTVSLASVRVVERAEPVPRAMGFDKLAAEESVAEVVGRHPLLQHRLISNDGRAAAVVVEGIESKANFAALEQRARATVPPEARLRIIGVPPVERAMHQTMVGDMMRCVGLESLVYLILLPLFFRTIRGVVIPMAVVLSGLAIYFGLMVALGWSVSIIETAIPGLIVIIGLCDAVHMLHRFEEERPNCADRTEAVAAMMRGVGVACLYTSWTTALGFLSLLIAPHAAVRDFAVSASVGIAAAWVSVMLLMPVLLAVWPMKMTGPVRTRRWSLPMFGRPRLTLAVFVLLAAVSVAGTLRVVVDSHWLEELPRRNEAVQNLRWFEERFGGLLTIDVVIEGDLADPQAIAAYEQLAERILAQPGVSHHDAYTQWVRELTARGSEASAAQLSRAVGAMRWLGNLFPAHLITPAMDRGRIRFYTLDFGTNRYFQIKSLIEREAAQLPDGLAARVGGFGLMAHRSSRLVVTTMMRSFGLSAVVITLFVALAYRSWRIGLM